MRNIFADDDDLHVHINLTKTMVWFFQVSRKENFTTWPRKDCISRRQHRPLFERENGGKWCQLTKEISD